MNEAWFSIYDYVLVKHLPHMSLYHSSIIVYIDHSQRVYYKKKIMFEQY